MSPPSSYNDDTINNNNSNNNNNNNVMSVLSANLDHTRKSSTATSPPQPTTTSIEDAATTATTTTTIPKKTKKKKNNNKTNESNRKRSFLRLNSNNNNNNKGVIDSSTTSAGAGAGAADGKTNHPCAAADADVTRDEDDLLVDECRNDQTCNTRAEVDDHEADDVNEEKETMMEYLLPVVEAQGDNEQLEVALEFDNQTGHCNVTVSSSASSSSGSGHCSNLQLHMFPSPDWLPSRSSSEDDYDDADSITPKNENRFHPTRSEDERSQMSPLSSPTTAAAAQSKKNRASDPPTLSEFLQGNLDDDDDDKDDDYDDDMDSAATLTAYFEPSDFNPANWLIAMEYAPTFGFAVVALATAVTHPLLFVAGALATATAAGYHYNTCPNDTTTMVSSISFVTDTATKLFFPCYKYNENEATMDETTPLPPTSGRETSAPAESAALLIVETSKTDSKKEVDDISTAASSSGSCNDPLLETTTQRAAQTKHHKPPHVNMMHHSRHLTDDSAFLLLTDGPGGMAETLAWVDRHYPRLELPIIEREDFVGLNVMEFFQVYFADNAPYNFLEFQKKRGDINIKYEPWTNISADGSKSPLSMHPKTSTVHDELHHAFVPHSHQTRTLTFQAKTNTFFGPPYATTIKTQRWCVLNKRLAVLESKTVLEDIPFSDRFYVMERWIVQAEKEHQKEGFGSGGGGVAGGSRSNLSAHEDEDRYTSYVSASCEVFFTGKCPFEMQIRSKSKSTIMEVTFAWSAMAKEALKLAMKAKQKRLESEEQEHNQEQQQHQDETTAHEQQEPPRSAEDMSIEIQSIEVEHIQKKQPPTPISLELPSPSTTPTAAILNARSSSTLSTFTQRTAGSALNLFSFERIGRSIGSSHRRTTKFLNVYRRSRTRSTSEVSTLEEEEEEEGECGLGDAVVVVHHDVLTAAAAAEHNISIRLAEQQQHQDSIVPVVRISPAV